MDSINTEIEERADTLNDELGLLSELLDESDLAAPRTSRTSKKRASVDIAGMSADEYRAYKARLQSERRQRIRNRQAAGSIPFDAASAREALADAALMLLATDGPGSEEISTYLRKIFTDQPSAPLTIQARAKSGALKPRLIRFARA